MIWQNGTDISKNISEYIGEKYLANTAISDEVTIADSW